MMTGDFFFAFSVQHTTTKKVLYDESLVRFMGLVSEGDGKEQYVNPIEVGVHKCNATDFINLKKPTQGSEYMIERMKNDSSLFCFDELDINGNAINSSLYGRDDNSEHRRIELIYMPCLTYREIDKTLNISRPDQKISCRGSMDNYTEVKAATEEYLKDAEVVVVYNQAKFDNQYFDERMIKNSSQAWSRVFTPSEPSWIHSMLTQNSITDETELFNFGTPLYTPERLFNSYHISGL